MQIQPQSSSLETVSIIASIVSVILGFVAIWLSVTFYRLSNKITEDTKEAAKGISASVDRLESLFDRLYSDTFSMMRETVSDMRKHIWPEKDTTDEAISKIEAQADKKIETMKNQLTSELSSVIHQLGKTDRKISQVESSVSDIIEKAIHQTRKVEMETQEKISMADVLNGVLRYIRGDEKIPVRRILTHPLLRNRFPRALIEEALHILVKDSMIEIKGSLDQPDSTIRMLTNEERSIARQKEGKS